MVLHECPFCHRLFEAQLLSKEQVDSSESTRVGDFPLTGSMFGGITWGGYSKGPLILGLSEVHKDGIARNPQAFITYKLSYKCKHCGTEWSKLSVEEKPIPREYLVDDQEKTDYDADVEEEEAREEEYTDK
jgi:hypothetical protein